MSSGQGSSGDTPWHFPQGAQDDVLKFIDKTLGPGNYTVY